METGSDGDYFLLENRQKYGFDAAIPGAGLMIYHVHPNIERYHTTNTVNATSPQGFYPVCASYSEPGSKEYGNINSAECPFPGSKNVKSFTPETSPAAVAWSGSPANVYISNISMNHLDGSISFTTATNIIDDPDDPDDPPIEKNLVYKESFENNAYDKLTINSLFGTEVWRTYAKGNFILNANFIPEVIDGKRILMLHAGKKGAINESEVVSSAIEVEPGSDYTLAFDICTDNNFASISVFNVFIEDKYGEYNVYTMKKDISTKWKTIEIPLTFASDNFSYKLYGRLDAGGIFIDNVRLSKEGPLTSITTSETDTSLPTVSVFSVTGVRQENLRKGINIVRRPDGSTVKVLIK